MSDLVSALAWIGETPDGEHATLFLYPATDFDPESGTKIALLASLWGLEPIASGRPPAPTGVPISIAGHTLILAGETIPLGQAGPADDVAEWTDMAQTRRAVFLLLTSIPMTSPTHDQAVGVALSRPAQTWYGLAPAVDVQPEQT